MSTPAQGAVGAETAGETVTILYENYRGETAVRRITPIGREWFGSSDWHPEPQWLFTAFDMDKEAFRDFARAGVKAWGQAAVDAALSTPAPRTDGGMTAGEAVKQFAHAVLHGDDEHRGWLTEAAECFVAGRPLPEPRGKGTQTTPAQPAGGVPEGLRALSEALESTKAAADDLASVCIEEGDNKAAGALQFISGFISDQMAAIATHPAGQSAGSGAEIIAVALADFQRRNGYHKPEIEELLTEFGELLLSREATALQQVTAERDEARADLKAAEDSSDALNVKLHALAPHGSCACSYDKPGDVCMHHSPSLAAANAELARLRAEGEAKDRALKPFADYADFAEQHEWPKDIAEDPTTPVLGRAGWDGEIACEVTVGDFLAARAATAREGAPHSVLRHLSDEERQARAKALGEARQQEIAAALNREEADRG